MAIVGMGTDIVDIARFDTEAAQRNRLAKRVLTDSEWQIYIGHSQPARYLAKRFAAKEAAVKALGTGIGQGIGWQQITVSNNDAGAPLIAFSGHFAQLCSTRGVTVAHLSLSDEQHYAVATVILESST